MPKKGYIQLTEHRQKLIQRAKLRGNNGWLGRKHRPESIEKMRRPHSQAHIARIRLAALKRWKEKNKKTEDKKYKAKIEPAAPQVYTDIYIDEWEGIKDVL